MNIKQVLGSLNLGCIRRFLMSLYHREGPGRKPYNPVSMLKHACVERLVKGFRKRVSVERLFSRAKEWLLLDHLRVRGLEQVFIHVALSLSAMLAIALTALRQHQPRLIRSIKHYTT